MFNTDKYVLVTSAVGRFDYCQHNRYRRKAHKKEKARRTESFQLINGRVWSQNVSSRGRRYRRMEYVTRQTKNERFAAFQH